MAHRSRQKARRVPIELGCRYACEGREPVRRAACSQVGRSGLKLLDRGLEALLLGPGCDGPSRNVLREPLEGRLSASKRLFESHERSFAAWPEGPIETTSQVRVGHRDVAVHTGETWVEEAPHRPQDATHDPSDSRTRWPLISHAWEPPRVLLLLRDCGKRAPALASNGSDWLGSELLVDVKYTLGDL